MPIPYSEENVTAVTTPTVAWAVSATHNFLNQAITATTSLITAGLSTPGTQTYVEDFLLTDYDLTLPQIGSISHFVSPNQPVFTFTKTTRVLMLIPVTTSTSLLRIQGWVYFKPVSVSAASVDDTTAVITNSPADYFFEKLYPAGTHNMDPSGVAPLAFYFFQERSFEDQIIKSVTAIGENSETLTTLVSNTHKFYQSTGKYNADINFGGQIPTSSVTGIHDTSLDANTGLHDHWRQYDSWNNTGHTGVISNSTIFTATTTGVSVIKQGYYRCAVNLHFQTDTAHIVIGARWAKNNVIDGPVGISNRVKTGGLPLEAASLSVTWIFFCIPNDTISLYTSRVGGGNLVSAKTREGLSSIIIEYIGN